MSPSSPFIADLPYREDPAEWFEHLAGEAWSMFLDSHAQLANGGRFSIMTACPLETLVSGKDGVHIEGGDAAGEHQGQPLSILATRLSVYRLHMLQAPADLPFSGGALGYLSYDFGRRLEELPTSAIDDIEMPDLAFGIYDWALCIDHQQSRATLCGLSLEPSRREFYTQMVARLSRDAPVGRADPLQAASPAQSNLTKAEYAQAFTKIGDYIRAGDCYQVNLAQRFSLSVTGDPWLGYRNLRADSPVPFGAYLELPWAQVLSFSPERFLCLSDRAVETWPIKGTRPRGSTLADDVRLAEQLCSSSKDQAENLMIVDLLRNDLGRCCVPGTIQVEALFELQSYQNVHHLVSRIKGQLRSGLDATDLLRACFPGGSITGAPKLRAMEIIEELEPHRRSLYCGSIAYLGFDGRMDSNIAIRTLIHQQGILYFWAGGGIVADSLLESEYAETFQKASAMLARFPLKRSTDERSGV